MKTIDKDKQFQLYIEKKFNTEEATVLLELYNDITTNEPTIKNFLVNAFIYHTAQFGKLDIPMMSEHERMDFFIQSINSYDKKLKNDIASIGLYSSIAFTLSGVMIGFTIGSLIGLAIGLLVAGPAGATVGFAVGGIIGSGVSSSLTNWLHSNLLVKAGNSISEEKMNANTAILTFFYNKNHTSIKNDECNKIIDQDPISYRDCCSSQH